MAISEKILKAPPSTAAALDPRDHFGTVLYTGTGSAQSVNGGKYDGCIEFNGSNSAIQVPSFGTTFQNNYTVSCWFKLDSYAPNNSSPHYGLKTIFAHFEDYYGWIAVNGTSSSAKLRFYTEYLPSAPWGYGIESTTSIALNTWYHMVCTKSSTTGMKIYINGSLETTESAATQNNNVNTSYSSAFGIYGAISGNNHSMWDGLLDHARIYDSVLSASEVTELYNESYADSFKVNFPTGKTTKALYRFNGNTNDETGVYNSTATANLVYKYGVNFTPDLVWVKRRNSAQENSLYDSVRGVQKVIYADISDGQATETNSLSSFDSGGFSFNGGSGLTNGSGNTHVAWCWKGGDSNVTNNDGSVASTVSVNTDGGFSVVKHTAPSSEQNYTIGHGLGVKPSMVFLKGLDGNGRAWFVWHKDLSQESYYLYLQDNYGEGNLTQDTRIWGQQAFTDEVISARSNYTTILGEDYISYCWADVDGYQKAGSYTGNGNDHGPMVETGFKPAFLMIKCATSGSSNWRILDSARNPSNPINKELYPSLDNAEGTYTAVNFYSDGFQVINTDVSYNTNNETYVYLAIAEPPETTTPVVADSFNIATWTGNDSSVNPRDVEMTFGGEKPGLVWIKARDNGNNNHQLYDIVRGAGSGKNIQSNETYYEGQYASTYGYLSSFNTDGFELTTGSSNANFVNENGATYVGWGWKASGSSEILTGSGSNNDVVASVNDNAGFSVVTYEGTGSSGMKIRHGLSATPAMVIVKKLDANAAGYLVWVDQGLTDFDYWMYLNTNGGQVDSVGTGFSAAPDANLLTFGTSGIGNDANLRYVAYSWRRVSGYSGFGTYTGNGGTNAITINDGGSGFQPDFVLAKPIGTGSWLMMDSVRGANKQVYADLASAEYTDTGNSFHSTGFTMKSNGNWNNNTVVYTYAAFKIN